MRFCLNLAGLFIVQNKKIIDFETQELKKKRLDELADNIAIDDFE